jgi:hypothetical protein
VKTISKVSPVFCFGLAIAAFAVEPSAPLFENDDVKVMRALEKAHVKGSFHEHKPNRVMVYLQSGKQRFEYQNGRQPAVFDWKAGQVVWSPADGMHSPEVVGDEPFNIVEVELKKPGAGQAVAAKLDKKLFTTEFDNDQVRAVRLTLAAHKATQTMVFPGKHVAIFLSDQEIRVTDAHGAVETMKHKLGEATWDGPGSQKLENVGNKPLEVVLVELKY